MYRILIAEDNKAISNLIKTHLSFAGYDTSQVYDGEVALEILEAEPFDLLILDLMLPKVSGVDILARVKDFRMPIIVVTALDDLSSKVQCLQVGADDYITKPFGVSELISRVKAVLRRTDGAAPNNYSVGGISLDDGRRLVCAEGRQCALTYTEYELLKALVSNCGMVLSREKLMVLVWGTDFAGESRTVDVHVKTLRQKLGSCGDLIKTVRNVGYKIEMQ